MNLQAPDAPYTTIDGICAPHPRPFSPQALCPAPWSVRVFPARLFFLRSRSPPIIPSNSIQSIHSIHSIPFKFDDSFQFNHPFKFSSFHPLQIRLLISIQFIPSPSNSINNFNSVQSFCLVHSIPLESDHSIQSNSINPFHSFH